MEEKKMTISELVQTDDWKKFMKKLEIFSAVFLGIIILMIALGFTTNKSFGLILTLTLSTLSITCFFTGFQNFNSESKILAFIFYKIYGFGLALGFMTLLFIKQKWPYPNDLLAIISTILIVISIILGIRERTSEKANNIDWKYFLRIFVALVPLIYMMIQK
jgi:hypothetical protein